MKEVGFWPYADLGAVAVCTMARLSGPFDRLKPQSARRSQASRRPQCRDSVPCFRAWYAQEAAELPEDFSSA